MFESIAVPVAQPRRRRAVIAAGLAHLLLALTLVVADAWSVDALTPPVLPTRYTALLPVPVTLGTSEPAVDKPRSPRPRTARTAPEMSLRPARPPETLPQAPAASTSSGTSTDSSSTSAEGDSHASSGVPWGTDDPAPSNETGHLAPDPAIVYAAESVDVKPARVADCADPRYPHTAHTLRIQGDVELSAVIGADGSVEQIEVVSGNSILARAAVDAAGRCRYSPARLRGRAVASHLTWKVHFVLR